jgi:DMSO/TMAO reductase YedYZ molybdopterin-dependent catalytic subunit
VKAVRSRTTPDRPGWAPALAVAALAAVAAMLLQAYMRDSWQIRTLPERVMEWLLVFVPLAWFEAVLQRFGSDAKQGALAGSMIGMVALLIGIGFASLRRPIGGWGRLAVAGALWLIVMLVVMPMTGAGLFASRLMQSPLLVNAGYLLVFLGYGVVLVGGGAILEHPRLPPLGWSTIQRLERRALVAALVGSASAWAVARIVGRDGGLVSSSLPLAQAPTRPPATRAAAAPTSAAASQAVTTAPAAVGAPPALVTATAVPVMAAPAATATPLPDALPSPPPARRLTRDAEGSLTAAGRPRGALAPAITSNPDFYVVTKNAVADPVLDAATWRLVIDGEVGSPVQVDYRTLRALPPVEIVRTIECISNLTTACHFAAFGCDLISNARFTGARLSDVLDLAGGLKPRVQRLGFISADEFSSGLPPEIADDPDTLLVYEMNGETLPREHGYPVRLLVPGRYGMKSAKWVVGIRAVPDDFLGWYEQRSWNKEGIVKTMARIDVPFDGAVLSPGPSRIAGIAYAGLRGIQQVEYSPDGGQTWFAARFLEPQPGRDAMVRWEGTFELAPGQTRTLLVRATDGSGELQPDDFSLPQPDGASGRHFIEVRAV